MSAVALFVPCYAAVLRPADTEHAVRVLRALGDVVEVIDGGCCGQPAYNSGYRDEAHNVGRELLRAGRTFERVVVPSGSCVTMIQHYLPGLFAGSRGDRAHAIADRFVEFASYVAHHRALDRLPLA